MDDCHPSESEPAELCKLVISTEAADCALAEKQGIVDDSRTNRSTKCLGTIHATLSQSRLWANEKSVTIRTSCPYFPDLISSNSNASLGRSPFMKMLFSSRDGSEIKSLRQELSRAGIQCQVKKNRIAQGAFGIAPFPELWIKRDSDILKALRKIGTRRLREMTVIFPTPAV